MQDKPEKGSAEATARKKILKVMVRSMFLESWDAKASDATPEKRKAAFQAALPELRKTAFKMRRYMERKGVVLTLDASADDKK